MENIRSDKIELCCEAWVIQNCFNKCTNPEAIRQNYLWKNQENVNELSKKIRCVNFYLPFKAANIFNFR